MDGLRTFFSGLDWSVPLNMLLSVIPALVCITLHELSHGLVAYKLGDTTAKDAGRLTLNPVKHIDVMGLVMMVVFRFGWAKPVPVNMYRFKNPKAGMAICAAAGPISNLLLTIVLLFAYGLLYYPLARGATVAGDIVLSTIMTTAYLSLALAVFNIIPLPPLDGSKVLFSFMSQEAYYKLMRYERYGMILLFILVALNVTGAPLRTATEFLFDKLFAISRFGFELVLKFVG